MRVPFRWLHLLLCLMLAIHLGSTSVSEASVDQSCGGFASDVMSKPQADLPPAGDVPEPAAAHPSPACHDHCKGTAPATDYEPGPTERISIAADIPATRPSSVSILLPPPQ